MKCLEKIGGTHHIKEGERMEKFKNRKEQREVTETMNALLLPMLNFFDNNTAIKVKRALYLLGEIEIEPKESEDK